MQHLHLKTNNH